MDIFFARLNVPRTMLSHRFALRNLASVILVATGVNGIAASVEDWNAAFGVGLFADENLWDDQAADVAERLGWPKESETSCDASYRKYPGPGELILGCRPYSVSLLAEMEKPSQISMVFANKGDSISPDVFAGDQRKARKELKGFSDAIAGDAARIEQTLTALAGPPAIGKFGQGRTTRESVKRWDWNGHSFLLAAPKGEYVVVRIMPIAAADSQGRSRLPDDEIRKRAATRIEHRPNGDVILRDIPMVDQGPKGYCVPATWERVMRYMGVPADMYVLAMAGNTAYGGGTSLAGIIAGARDAIERGGRRVETLGGRINLRNVQQNIDRGLPIMWALFSLDQLNTSVNARMIKRASMTNTASWSADLVPFRKSARELRRVNANPHMCMIIGYNDQTGEIAVSDSWGPEFAERWMTLEEADAVSQGSYMVIEF